MDGSELGPVGGGGDFDFDHEAGDDQLAFAAYEDAWHERDSSGRTSSDLLLAALAGRKVSERAYAPGTRLHRALFDSWEDGRRPRRMHGVIARYRFRKALGVPGEIARFFRDTTPEHMKMPSDLVAVGKWRPADDETTLEFVPSGTFAARIGAWYDAIDDDERTRAIPVWLDTGARPERTAVMVGTDLAGHTDLPREAHALLVGATKKGRRVVATGDLWVKRRKNGTYRIDDIEAELPDPDD